ncbi:beta-galactosidase [Microbacterium sp. M]|uniref:beta-galactosidase n=1 Tax=Microbacterium sp. M TaxID=3377125 RepID=UPI00386895E1
MNDELSSTLTRRLGGIAYGGDYNPEQWDRATWVEDVRLMCEAGVNLVTVGVFSWSSLEPRDGHFTFGWLDEIIDLLWSNGIAVDLATPNAAPPPWLAGHTDTLLVERDGRRVSIGSRGHFCPSSELYRDRSRRIASALAERYRNHPAIALWHIGNEYHAHCFCDTCDSRFRGWLQHRYGSLEELNDRWGTTFWSQGYDAWDQVHLPSKVRGHVNPTRELDFSRFTSEVQHELFLAERDILRAAAPGIPITTNFMAFFPLIDYRRWAEGVDVVSLDMYPDPAVPGSLIEAAFQYDLMRSLRHGQPWLLLEQASSAVSQWQVNVAKSPERMRLGSYQAVARGADSVMFFQWRASRYGQEKFHSAMVPHGGESTDTWRAVRALGQELDTLRDVPGSRIRAEAAIVWDWDNKWAVEGAAHPLNSFSYRDVVMEHYRALWRTGVHADVISLDDDLSAYRVIVVPNQYLLSQHAADALRRFVENGGHVLVSYFSGIVDEHDHVALPGYAPGLRETIGAHVRDITAIREGEAIPLVVSMEIADLPGSAAAMRWQDDIGLETATALVSYGSGRFAGRPAVTDNRLGAGRAIYVGTTLDEGLLGAIMSDLVKTAGVRPPLSAPADVEVVERRSEAASYLFALNHSDEARNVVLEREAIDRLTGVAYSSGHTLELAPQDVAVLFSARIGA